MTRSEPHAPTASDPRNLVRRLLLIVRILLGTSLFVVPLIFLILPSPAPLGELASVCLACAAWAFLEAVVPSLKGRLSCAPKIRWSRLRTLGESRLVQSSFVWLLVTPLIARATSDSTTLHLPVGLAIPFLAALFFAAGTVTYALHVPSIARYKNSVAYESTGRSKTQLQDQVVRLYKSGISKSSFDSLVRTLGWAIPEAKDAGQRDDHNKKAVEEAVMKCVVSSATDSFYAIKRAADYHKPTTASISFACYAAGLLLIAAAASRNAMIVVHAVGS